MLRFIKGSITTLRLGEMFIDNLSRNFHESKQILAPVIIPDVYPGRNVNSKRNFMKFSTSTISTTDTEEASTSEPDITKITGGDTDLEHKLRVLILEAEVLRQEGKAVPENSSIKTHNWQELLKLNSRTARRKYFEFLFKLEKKNENRAKKKEQKRLEWEENPRPEQEDDQYRLGRNSFFLRFYDTTINQMYNNRLIQAMQFGQKLVVDCGYHENMSTRENSNCAKQLMLLFAENRMNDEPFDLHYCNTIKDSSLMKGLHKFIGTLYEPQFPLNLHEQSYLDIFPKEKLVYLTPHCREVINTFDHDAIYIIGALVDKMNNEPLSLAKAKKEGLRMAKLPLDHFLDWGSGSGKSLTINQVISILLDAKRTGDWNYAFRHVPRRKLAKCDNGILKERPSYTREPQISRTSSWKPNTKKNLDQLSFKTRRDEEEHKSGTARLLDLKKMIKNK